MRLAATLLLLAAVAGAQQKRVLPWEKNHNAIGQALYRENCVVCHDIDLPQKQSKKLGPSFYRLFERDKMPIANAAPSREYIAVRVRFGGKIMPAFAKRLTAAEIDTLIDYIAAQ